MKRLEYTVVGRTSEWSTATVNNHLALMASKGWRYIGPDGCGREVFEREIGTFTEPTATAKRGGGGTGRRAGTNPVVE